MEKNDKQVEAQGVKTKKVSKTAVLASIRTLEENLIILGWNDLIKLDLIKIREGVKAKIIEDL